MKVGITGGNGFIGKKIILELLEKHMHIISMQRSSQNIDGVEIRNFDLSNISDKTKDIFSDIDVVIHTAALVHNRSANRKSHQKINFDATIKLVEICKSVGVQYFIFLSTVGVYGVSSSVEKISLKNKVNPISEYAKSKLDVENILLSNNSQMQVSILRLPLVYGDAAKGNFRLLEKIADTPIPLPFLNIKNKRSMVSVENVAKIIGVMVRNKNKYLGLHLLAEKKSFSTEEIIKTIKINKERRLLLFPVPTLVMKFIMNMLGQKKLYQQLFEDLEFKSSIDLPN
jgi:nucleoside-diphosphate-sugar epimerase